MRHGIELEPGFSEHIDQLYSQGCFAIRPSEYPAFKAALLKKIQREGTQYLTLGPGGHVLIGPKQKAEEVISRPPVPGKPGAAPVTPMGGGSWLDYTDDDPYPLQQLKVVNNSSKDIKVAKRTDSDAENYRDTSDNVHSTKGKVDKSKQTRPKPAEKTPQERLEEIHGTAL